MRTKYIAVVQILILFIGISCKHEIPEKPRQWDVETIIDRGNIVDLGVSLSEVCILNSKPEVGMLDRTERKWQFYNSVNSLITDVSEVQSAGDTALFLADGSLGIIAIEDTGIVRIDTTLNTIGMDYSSDVCRANVLGLFLYTNGKKRRVQNQFNFGTTRLASMAGKEDTLWIGTLANGLFYADMVNKKIRQASYTVVASYRVKQVTYDKEGALWVICEKGVSRHKNGNWQVYKAPTGLKINHIARVNNDTYLATDKGIYELNMVTGEYVAVYDINVQLPYPVVNVIEPDEKGRLWAGTGTGLILCSKISN